MIPPQEPSHVHISNPFQEHLKSSMHAIQMSWISLMLLSSTSMFFCHHSMKKHCFSILVLKVLCTYTKQQNFSSNPVCNQRGKIHSDGGCLIPGHGGPWTHSMHETW